MTSNEFYIRRARAEDVAAITECIAKAYSHYIERIGKAPAPMLQNYGEVFGSQEMSVLTNGETICGVVVLIPDSDRLIIDNVAVDSDYQRKGLGKRLMSFAESEAQRLGLAVLTLYTNEHMTENIEIYKKLGYSETERRTENGYHRVYMHKILKT